jgi:PDDEXK-like domain of unknown function (DUF3799)
MTTTITRSPMDIHGIHPNITEHDYHTHTSLSHTGARLILDCPARYRWAQDHPRHSAAFDFGSAAHTHILGTGGQTVIIDADDWRTKVAKDARDEARANGHNPILAAEHKQIVAMADALRSHPIAKHLLSADGTPETSLRWAHGGIELRARADWYPTPKSGRRPILWDYKTTADASTAGFSKSVANFGYHTQAAWYLDGHRTLTGTDAVFLFLAQEKVAPYLVNVIELDQYALQIGAALNQQAIDIYQECTTTGVWPGYSEQVELVELPIWAQRAYEQQTINTTDGAPW